MKSLSEAEFLHWAEARDVGVADGYPRSAHLVFRPDSGEDRFWCVPPEPHRRPHFIASLLDLMGDWQACCAWRHCGSWPNSADPRRINDVVELTILNGLGMPLGTADVVEFGRDERDKLISLIFSTTIFGWSVNQDLYVVPNHGRYLLKTDHHDVIHISIRAPGEVEHWESEMTKRGFPLPDDPPDETFKRPIWMKHPDGES